MSAMDQLKDAFSSEGLEMPTGLVDIIHYGYSKQEIFKKLWIAVKFLGKLGAGYKTYTFPLAIHQAVRDQFPEEKESHFDHQYEGRKDVYHVSMYELTTISYPRIK